MWARLSLVLICFFFGLNVIQAQPLAAYWNTSSRGEAESEAAVRHVEKFVSDQQGTTGSKHLAKVFRKFHHTFLKRYEAYSDFSSLFYEGTYDCLTATTLLNYILDELGYQTEIIETTYHIFIKVHTAKGEVLLETTDRAGGFIMEEQRIAERIAGYRKDELPFGDRSLAPESYRYRCSVYRTVKSSDLVGLLLFNQAVKAYNGRNWLASAKYLEAAFTQYPSGRCYELAAILLRTLQEHREIVTEDRQVCMEYLVPILVRRSGAVVAN